MKNNTPGDESSSSPIDFFAQLENAARSDERLGDERYRIKVAAEIFVRLMSDGPASDGVTMAEVKQLSKNVAAYAFAAAEVFERHADARFQALVKKIEEEDDEKSKESEG